MSLRYFMIGLMAPSPMKRKRLLSISASCVLVIRSYRIHDGKHHGYRCSPNPYGIIAALAFYGDGIDDSYAKDY